MNDKYLKESLDVLNRKFGDPLPTIEDTARAYRLRKEGELPPALKKAIAKKKGEEVKEGGPGSGRPTKDGSAKDIDNKMGKAVDDANARLDAAEKAMKKKNESQLDENLLRQIRQAEKIAKKMGGNMTGAVKAIEKIRRGLTHHKRVKVALKKYNESVNKVTEGPDDVKSARKILSKIAKTETKFRKEMFELEQAFLQDPRDENKKIAKEVKRAYKDGVTQFMRDSVKMIKRMK